MMEYVVLVAVFAVVFVAAQTLAGLLVTKFMLSEKFIKKYGKKASKAYMNLAEEMLEEMDVEDKEA